MIFLFRRWPLLFVVGCGCLEIGRAQESGSSGSSGGTSSGGTSSGSSSGSSGTPSAFSPWSASGPSGSSSSFSINSNTPQTTEGGTGQTGTSGTTSESAFSGSSFGNGALREAPPSFSVPGFYGQGTTQFFGGSGRLARPKFRMNVTFGAGYDDNLFQTPSDVPGLIPGGSQVVQTGEEPIYRYERRFYQNGFPGTYIAPVQIGTEPIYEEITTPDTEGQDRRGSLFTREGLSLEVQRYSRRSLFVLDANINRSYYFDRDQDPDEYNGGINMTYLHRFTPRLQSTVQINAAYLSQPDLSRVNTPQAQIPGSIINFLARADVAYRINPRLSLTLTGNYSGNRYTEKSEQGGDFDEITFGLEARYLYSPRWTWLAEYRHGFTTYPNRSILDSSTDYLLVGSEFIVTRRLTGSLRVGQALKTFEESGDSQLAPYVESTITYQSTARSSVGWTNRLGFEEPNSPDEERLVYRSTLNYNYLFSPRMRGSTGVSLVHELQSFEEGDTLARDTFELTLGLEYQITRDFTLNASYTFTLLNTNIESNETTGSQAPDYYRNRVFFGGQYSF